MAIEKHSLSFVPEEERHGKAKDLFYVWFSANMDILVIVTGAMAIGFGLNILWALIAVILGNVVGGVFMASHSAQGPKLGIPQMVQSRAQFGVFGAILPLILVIGMYLGAFLSCGLLGAQAVHSAIPSISVNVALIIMGIVTIFITVYGYDLIHKVEKYLAILFLIVFGIATIIALRLPFPSHSLALTTGFNLPHFIIMTSIAATYQMTYAPYVADYSRYLPKKTSSAATFWYSYAGNVIGCTWMMILGVLLASGIHNYTNDASGYLSKLFGPFSSIMYLSIVLGIIAIQVLNLYGAFMSTITTVEAFIKINDSVKMRFSVVGIIAVVGTILAMSGQNAFMTIWSDFMLFLQYFLLPWSAINLIDFYFLHHGIGDYSLKDMFDVNGKYGKFNWIALGAYFITIICQIPFMSTSLFEGVIAKALQGADIAWAVAFILPVLIYYIPMRKWRGSNVLTYNQRGDRVVK